MILQAEVPCVIIEGCEEAVRGELQLGRWYAESVQGEVSSIVVMAVLCEWEGATCG